MLTLALGGLIFGHFGASGLWLFAILVVLEVTFSFDNAVINSKVLAGMSQVWQKVFLTVGIFVAVFVVRFVLPIIIVMVASGHGFMEVVDLALNKPVEYGHILHEASPMIDAFGGAFLIMIGLSYFIDYNKRVHWMRHVEPWLSKAGRFENFKVCLIANPGGPDLQASLHAAEAPAAGHPHDRRPREVCGVPLLHRLLRLSGAAFRRARKKGLDRPALLYLLRNVRAGLSAQGHREEGGELRCVRTGICSTSSLG